MRNGGKKLNFDNKSFANVHIAIEPYLVLSRLFVNCLVHVSESDV